MRGRWMMRGWRTLGHVEVSDQFGDVGAFDGVEEEIKYQDELQKEYQTFLKELGIP